MTMAMRPPRTSFRALFTANRQREALRIVVVGVVAMGYWAALVPLWTLLVAVPLGLYPLVRTGLKDLIHERKIGTEIFVTVATVIAMISGEYVAAAVLMTIILIAEFIADMNTDRARASISALIGSVPVTATVRTGAADRTVPISDLRAGDVVLVRAGEGVPVDGTVIAGEGSANEASITGESVPVDKENGASVLAGTVLESGALDLRTDRVGAEAMFARIIALVESAEAQRASSETGRPCGRLADSVVFVFLLVVFVVTRDPRTIVTLLIFTSPAELGLATPLVMIAAIARAAKSGILIKGGVYLELLAKVNGRRSSTWHDREGSTFRNRPTSK